MREPRLPIVWEAIAIAMIALAVVAIMWWAGGDG
jgi:hypothetical protein